MRRITFILGKDRLLTFLLFVCKRKERTFVSGRRYNNRCLFSVIFYYYFFFFVGYIIKFIQKNMTNCSAVRRRVSCREN